MPLLAFSGFAPPLFVVLHLYSRALLRLFDEIYWLPT
jgi:hypothetical protein